MLGTRQPIKKKAPLGATALPGDLSGAGGYGSGVVMPFVGAPACLQGRVICEPCEHITRPSRVSCASRTRGGRHAVAGRKRASTTERPLPHLWERSRDAVCRRASVSARSCDMRAMRAYHTTVPSVLRQQDARGQTRCSGTQTSKHDGATFAADFSAAVFLGYDKLLPPAARARARRRHGRASGGARDAGGHTGAARHQRPQGMANRVQKKGTGEKIF